MIIQTAPDYFNRSYGNKDDSDRHKKKQNIKNLVHFTLFYLKCTIIYFSDTTRPEIVQAHQVCFGQTIQSLHGSSFS